MAGPRRTAGTPPALDERAGGYGWSIDDTTSATAREPSSPTTLPPPPRRCRIGELEIGWDERVLRPRPWTWWQARWAAELHPTLPPGPVVELCCGAGHIGLLAIRETRRPGFLIDADPVACDHARANAVRARLDDLVTVVEHRMDGGPIPGVDSGSPLVLADPPYVPSEQADQLPTDPRSAIDGGRDGLEVVHAVLRSAHHHLAPEGVCLLQVHGARQADQIERRLTDAWGDVGMIPGEVRTFGADRAVQLLIAAPDGIGRGSAG